MRIKWVVGVICLLAAWTTARAEDAAPPSDVATTIQALKERNRDLERRLTDLESKMGEGTQGQQMRQEEIKAIVEQMLAQNKQAMGQPAWLENLKFSGDLRFRYDVRQLDENAAAGTTDNTKIFRFRVRFGVTKTWPDNDLEVGFRLATGADNSPTSENQTFGSTNGNGFDSGTGKAVNSGSAFEEYPDFGIDRVYAKWAPKQLKGFMVEAGKFAQPWETSTLIWDPDVSPEGVYAEYRVPTNCPVEPFFSVGWFQLYTSNKAPNAYMESYSGGARWAITPDVKYTGAVNYFHFTNLDAAFTAAGTNGGIPKMSNSGISAGEYPILDVYNKVDFKTCNIPTMAYIDWAHNMSNQTHNGRSSAIAVGVKFGDIKKKGDWDARYVYKWIDQDAVVSYFAEDDFGYPSSTARKGSEVGFDYALTDSMTAGLTFFYDTPIAGSTAANNVKAIHILADLIWKF